MNVGPNGNSDWLRTVLSYAEQTVLLCLLIFLYIALSTRKLLVFVSPCWSWFFENCQSKHQTQGSFIDFFSLVWIFFLTPTVLIGLLLGYFVQCTTSLAGCCRHPCIWSVRFRILGIAVVLLCAKLHLHFKPNIVLVLEKPLKGNLAYFFCFFNPMCSWRGGRMFYLAQSVGLVQYRITNAFTCQFQWWLWGYSSICHAFNPLVVPPLVVQQRGRLLTKIVP